MQAGPPLQPPPPAWHTPPTQLPLVQSVFATHALPLAHAGQLPPQSMSVSVPFLMPSVQLAMPPWHTPFWQVAPIAQAFPHAPQLFTSWLRSTQTLLQQVV